MIDPIKARKFMEKKGLLDTIGEKTPYKDKTGKDIFVGDLVDFYFSTHPICIDHTLMEDIVMRYNDKYYFVDPEYGGGFAWRYASNCKIKGTLRRQ